MWRNGYYYRQHWQGDTCTTEYIGAGPVAELIAQQDAIERQQRQAAREALKQSMAEQDAIDAEIDAVGAELGAVVDAVLLVNGYRQHRRQWRKQRGQTEDVRGRESGN
jgi:hypothetical protein